MICAIAPGKIILFGEHFVVKGKPALGLAVSVYAKVCVDKGSGRIYSKQLGEISQGSQAREAIELIKTLVSKLHDCSLDGVDVLIDSEIPVSAGMGSSAAVSVATAFATAYYCRNDPPDRDVVNRIAFEAEKKIHVRPSGVDNTLATYGGFVMYKSGAFERVGVSLPPEARILVVDSRVKRSTGKVVSDVLERYSRLENVMKHIYDGGESIVYTALDALRKGDLGTIGELMTVNHGLLWSIGASSKICDDLVHMLLEGGALGAKISGAGRGGVVIGLFRGSPPSDLVNKFIEKGFGVYELVPDYLGVRALQVYS